MISTLSSPFVARQIYIDYGDIHHISEMPCKDWKDLVRSAETVIGRHNDVKCIHFKTYDLDGNGEVIIKSIGNWMICYCEGVKTLLRTVDIG